MNHKQREYALARVTAIFANRLQALETKHKATIKRLTDVERADLLRRGLVKLNPDVTSVSTYTDVVQVFDFSFFEQLSRTTPEFEPAKAELEAQAQRVRDQIMLGDSEEAIRLLEAFASAG